MATDSVAAALTIASDDLREHWQGHRRLTRRVIDLFPERELFEFSLGGMRPFAALALEMQRMSAGGIQGLATRTWPALDEVDSRAKDTTTKDALLRLWDATTHQIDAAWAQIPPGRFEETDKAFGMWEGKVSTLFLYWIDNEIHHRGQGYVYLRTLGITPPPFYERA
jgi:uncharacterized damage-inducible protein DinB